MSAMRRTVCVPGQNVDRQREPDIAGGRSANPKLITQTSEEPIQGMMEFKGQIFKVNAVTKMSNALQRRFLQQDPKARSVFAAFTDVLLAGMVTCYGAWGTPRHIAVFDKMFIDQLD